MIIKSNQPTLLESAVRALAGPDADYTGASWAEEGNGHGRRERRSIRTAPADGIDWPHAAQVLRIRRDSGEATRVSCTPRYVCPWAGWPGLCAW